MKHQWTRGEKWLWATPLIVLIGAGAAFFGPTLVRKQLGRPIVLETTPDSKIASIALSADGSTLAATTGESYAPKTSGGTLCFWDARTLKPLAPWGSNTTSQINNAPAFRTEYRALVLSSDAKSVGFARVNLLKKGWDVPYKFFDTATGRVRWQIAGKYLLSDAHLSPDGAMLGLTERTNNSTTYRFLRVADGVEVTHFSSDDIDSSKSNFAWMPNSKSIVCLARNPDPIPRPRFKAERAKNRAAEQFFFETRRLSDGKISSKWKTRPVLRFDLAPDGRSLIVLTGYREGTGFENVATALFDRATGRELWTFKGTQINSGSYHSPLAFKFAPDGKTIAVLIDGFAETVALLDAEGGVRQRTLNPGEQNGYSRDALAWSPDSKRLYARGQSAVLVWDLD